MHYPHRWKGRESSRLAEHLAPGDLLTLGDAGCWWPCCAGLYVKPHLTGSSLACNNAARFVRRPVQIVPGFDREQETLGNFWRFMENWRSPDSFSGRLDG